jgi:hypothetical protein
MSFRRSLACGIAALTLSAGTALAAGAATPARAATAVCGRFCMTLYDEKAGTSYVMAVSGGGFGSVGQALTMSAPGPYYWEDFLSLSTRPRTCRPACAWARLRQGAMTSR